MNFVDDGVIKYDRSNFSLSGPINLDEYQELEYWRKKLYSLHLIGEYPEEKVGFGNISQKKNYNQFKNVGHPQFLITGTQTGKHCELNGNHYTRVIDYDIINMKLYSMGPIEASSESLTHAAIYLSNPEIGAVVHIHSFEIWSKMMKAGYEFTDESIPYGTKEMAQKTMEIVKQKNCGVFAMAGHKDGVVSFGKNLEEATLVILELHQKFSSRN